MIGRYVLTPEIFDALNETEPGVGGEIQLTDAFKILLKTQKIYGYEFEGERYDIGDKLDYLRASIEYALKRDDLKEDLKAYLESL
jgi:UTP--glucose-1-phosphate uridylyltransferase